MASDQDIEQYDNATKDLAMATERLSEYLNQWFERIGEESSGGVQLLGSEFDQIWEELKTKKDELDRVAQKLQGQMG